MVSAMDASDCVLSLRRASMAMSSKMFNGSTKIHDIAGDHVSVEQLPDPLFIVAPIHALRITKAYSSSQGAEPPQVVLPTLEEFGFGPSTKLGEARATAKVREKSDKRR